MATPSLNHPQKLPKPDKRPRARKNKRRLVENNSAVFFIDDGGELRFDSAPLKQRWQEGTTVFLRRFADEINKLLRMPEADHEMVELEARNLARRTELTRRLLLEAINVKEAASLLGTTRQTPHDRTQAGALLALKDRGQLWFPLWQFDPEAPDRVVRGLPEVLHALAVSEMAKAIWLSTPNAALEGRKPIDALRAGEEARVVTFARAVGAAAL